MTKQFESIAIHSGFGSGDNYKSSAIPIHQAAAFGYDSAASIANVFEGKQFGYIYSRISNPTVTAFEQKVTAIESGLGALALTSGMAAIHTLIQTLVKSGDHIVSGQSLFGGTYELFEDVVKDTGVNVSYVDSTSPDAFEKAIQPNTKFLYVEAIGNPRVDVPDLKKLVAIANANGIPLVVDTTLATPYILPAKEIGIHLVVYSATKYLGIGATTIGGVIVDTGNFDWRKSKSERIADIAKQAGKLGFLARAKSKITNNTGSLLSPQSAFILSLGVETLALRMEKHSKNALALAQWLETQPQVKEVWYPGLASSPFHTVASAQFNHGFGGLLSFRCTSKDVAQSCIDALKMAKNMANLGDSKTLVIHPSSTIYQKWSQEKKETAGVYDDLIRVSVGLEHEQDIINDFKQALG